MDHLRGPLPWAVAVYAVRVGATYLLEGLPRTLLRPGGEDRRALYAVLANLLVGIGGSGLVLARVFRQHSTPPAAAGISSPHRAIVMAFVGLAAGVAVYELQSPPSRALAALVNGFTQVLPVSAAEVLVCWAVPSTVAAVCRFPNPVLARLAAVAPGSILFGLYHILTALEPSPRMAGQSEIQAPLIALALMTVLAVGVVHHHLRRSRH